MPLPPLEILPFIVAGAVAAGFVNGLAGFGTSLFALSWWLAVMSPREAVALAFMIAIVSGLQGVLVIWRDLNWKRLARFLLPAFFGIPIGIQLLDFLDPVQLQILIGLFMVTYGLFFAFRKNLPALERKTPVTDGSIGFVSGILGAVAGLSGALPTMWNAMRPWTKAEQRSFLQMFNMVVLGISAGLLAADGGYTNEVLIKMIVVIPASMIAAQFGIYVYRRLSDGQFRRLIILLMLISGVLLLVRTVL